MSSPNKPKIPIGSNSPATPPSNPVASPSPKHGAELKQSSMLFKQLSDVGGECAPIRRRNYDSDASLESIVEGLVLEGDRANDISDIIDAGNEHLGAVLYFLA